MENNITEQDKQLLDFYYKKKKQKKIIIGIVFAIIILVGIAFIFFHISNQTNFKLYQEEITLSFNDFIKKIKYITGYFNEDLK